MARLVRSEWRDRVKGHTIATTPPSSNLRDPIGYNGGINLYRYVVGDAVNGNGSGRTGMAGVPFQRCWARSQDGTCCDSVVPLIWQL